MVVSSSDDIPTIKSSRSGEAAALKCPFCINPVKSCIDLSQHIYLEHQPLEICDKLVELISADMIPRSKVAAKIKECGLNEVDYQNNLGTYETRARYKVLKELLNDTKVE